jgi:hypothetical protein
MKVKVFQPNTHGKIEFTPTELEDLLNEVYSEGFSDGESSSINKSSYTWTAPGYGTWYTEITPTLANDTVVADHEGKNKNENGKSVFKNPSVQIKCDPTNFEAISKAITDLVTNAGIKAKPSCFDELAKELNF